jgi:periplasmic divalent cation tolerance protein
MVEDLILVSVTCPDVATAERIGRAAVEARLAACCHVGPSHRSVFRWKGGIPPARCV